MRCQFSVLNRELPEWRTILMKQLGFQINLPQLISQYLKNCEKDYEKKRQNTDEYKCNRYMNKMKKFSRGNGNIEKGGYQFKNSTHKQNQDYKHKFRCRSCNVRYSTELSRVLHEIIYHDRAPVTEEKDLISQDLKQTISKINYCSHYLNKSIKILTTSLNKKKSSRVKLSLKKKQKALKRLTHFQEEFY
ncbi:hypothetical protein M0813_00028 [Anaeramoeba flamelloides]|uniref:C2H2-type domain-containing protein n=1 Tax=Anaeramoeba flamelloides TaxID=1746091 RepID=A0ABQ8YWI4_9EUKA|nr:hypothetical protein M0813_00028 [Anaeramoeba flamelloides]